MKKILVSLLLLLCLPAYAGGYSISLGGGQEVIDTRLGDLAADLYQVVGTYRVDNGMILGVSVMQGYVNKSWAQDEGRYELLIGYTTRVKSFGPYIMTAYGKRTRDGLETINYHAVTIGSKILLSEKWFGDISYRYRNTNDITWKTDTYFAGLGYNITPKLSVQNVYGKTVGDYESNQFGIFITNKF